MLIFLLIIALIGTGILVFHITLELNSIEKEVTTLAQQIKKHYEDRTDDTEDQ